MSPILFLAEASNLDGVGSSRFCSLHLCPAKQQVDSSVVADVNDKLCVWKSDTVTKANSGSIQGSPEPSGDPDAPTTTFRLVDINLFEASDSQLIKPMISATVWRNQ
jgi:hypothetical protein